MGYQGRRERRKKWILCPRRRQRSQMSTFFGSHLATNVPRSPQFVFSFLQIPVPIFQQYQERKSKIKMKFFIPGILALGMFAVGESGYTKAQDLKLNVAQLHSVGNGALGYQLQCEGALGRVDYHAEGLPYGAKLDGDKIIIGASTQAGTYYVRVTGEDLQTGLVVEKIINLSVSRAEQINGRVPSGATGPALIPDADKLNAILNEFSTVDEVVRPVYEQNRYPTTEFPTGSSPGSINYEPIKIATTQTQATIQNRNTITRDDVTLKAGSERYQNAVKGITNLLSIIDQARANKLQAQNDLSRYTQGYNDALKKQRDSQNAIISAETKVKQIQSAIAGADAKIGNLNDQIAALNRLGDKLTQDKDNILGKINDQEQRRANLMTRLNDINANLGGLVDDLREQQQECQNNDIELKNFRKDLADNQKVLDELTKNRIAAENDVAAKRRLVDDLRAKLDAAENDLATAQIKLAAIRDDQAKLPAIINDLERKINQYTEASSVCAARTDDIKNRIDQLQNKDAVGLTNDIDGITSDLLGLRGQSAGIDKALAKNQQDLEKSKVDLDATRGTAAFLKAQSIDANEALRGAYGRGNDANTQVNFAKENLNAVNKRWEEECRIENEATLNLERARAEEQLAKLALDELVAHYSDALPYAIVPNGNGVNPGTPYGNNPSGSALGVATKGAQAFEVRDWTGYLSSAFGQGIHPRLDQNINKLYTFNFPLQNGLRNTGTYSCDGNGALRSINGRVQAVGSNYIDVSIDNGDRYRVGVAPCTQFAANQANFQLQVGDELIAKGFQSTGNNLSCQQAIALRK